MKSDYITKKEQVDFENNIIAHYKVKTKERIERIAAHVAAEQSTGTWVKCEKESPGLVKKYGAKAFDVSKDKFKIAFPLENFEGTNISMLLSTIAGNLFGMKGFRIRLEKLECCTGYATRFKGPKFGIKGVRKLVKIEKSPLIGTIIKPDIGLSPKEFAEVCREAAYGVDFIKDDELLSNQDYCPRLERIPLVMEALDKVKSETGREYLYATNITDSIDKILENADKALEVGANCLMVNFLTAGITSIKALAEDPSIKVPIHCHRDFHASFTRDKEHGVAFPVIAKLVRFCGGDSLHVGTALVGKMADSETLDSQKNLTESLGLKPVFPVCSGGLSPKSIKPLVEKMGKDIIMMSGGGIHGNSKGTKAGALEFRKALNQALNTSKS